MFVEKFLEIFARNADMDIVVDLDRNADTVALTDAKATGQYNVVFQSVFFYGMLQQFNDLLRALEMAGAANTNLNDQHAVQIFAKTSFWKKSDTVSGVTE